MVAILVGVLVLGFAAGLGTESVQRGDPVEAVPGRWLLLGRPGDASEVGLLRLQLRGLHGGLLGPQRVRLPGDRKGDRSG